MDKLICLFQKGRPGSLADFQDDEVKNQLLSGLPFDLVEIVVGYFKLTAAEITRKYDVFASQREALGLQALGPCHKPLLVVQDKQSSSDTRDTYREFEQVFAF